MATFYRQAARVLACVGPHQHKSEYLFNILEQSREYFQRKYGEAEAIRCGEARPWTALPYFSVPRFRLLRHQRNLIRVMAYFLKRAYFSRLWILQELYVGTGRITVCCGTDRQPLGHIFLLYCWALEWDTRYPTWLLDKSVRLLTRKPETRFSARAYNRNLN
jgi:hypothetical protein